MPSLVRHVLSVASPLVAAFVLLAACARDPSWSPNAANQGAPPPAYGQPPRGSGYGQPPAQQPPAYSQPPPTYGQPPPIRTQPPVVNAPPPRVPPPVPTAAPPPTLPAIDSNATALINALNKYRAAHGLAAIPASKSLVKVAQTHVADLEKSNPSGSCLMHSWSSGGPWSSCCYTADAKQAQCMWQKPREIAGFNTDGFEIAAGGGGLTPDQDIQLWDGDAPHRTVMLNQGDWASFTWKAVGGYSSAHYAVMWFAADADPAR